MLEEAKGEWAKAEKIYKAPPNFEVKALLASMVTLLPMFLSQALKDKDETLPGPRKRLVALHKSRGSPEGALVELVEYLDVWMTDVQAWLELSNLYLASEQHKHAAHCLEECILLEPYNYAHHCLYAEVQYTIGGMDGFELARKHYQLAVELKPDCARALYGLCLCAASLGGGKKPREDRSTMDRFFGATQSKLELLYNKSNDKGTLMAKALEELRDSSLKA